MFICILYIWACAFHLPFMKSFAVFSASLEPKLSVIYWLLGNCAACEVAFSSVLTRRVSEDYTVSKRTSRCELHLRLEFLLWYSSTYARVVRK
jgi:hypothetical protein